MNPILMFLSLILFVTLLSWYIQSRKNEHYTPAPPGNKNVQPVGAAVQPPSGSLTDKVVNGLINAALAAGNNAVKSSTTLRINLNGKEEVLDLSNGVTEEIVQKLVDAVHISPEAARLLLSGEMNVDSLKKAAPALFTTVTVKKNFNFKLGDKASG